jgi:UDP-N-acetylmuramoyl-tripeptide--D-alanyl-D-alanine ligase
VIPLELSEVAAATEGRLVGGDATITAITTDSRSVPPGSLFVALRGENHDGHDHIVDALTSGAVAYLAEHDRGDEPHVIVDDTWAAIGALAAEVRRRVAPVVVALTGSVGKTTTKDLAAAALRAGLRTVAAEGSYNNEVGVPLTIFELTEHTEVLVLEIGSRGVGHIATLAPIADPDLAIVTAVAGAHLEMFGDLDTVARAKRELVEALDATGTAVLNADDERVAAMASHTPGDVLTYGVGDEGAADVVATDVRLDRLARARFRIRSPWGSSETRLPLAGAQHVGNALAAVSAAAAVGVELDAAAEAVATAPVSRWRSAVTEHAGIVVINDAYNANPTSVRAALDTLRRIERPGEGETWAVLGVMAELGETARTAHEEIGRVAAEHVDHLVVVGDEAAGIADGAAGVTDVSRVEDAEEALERIREEVDTGDVVLVKGSRVAGLERVADGLAEELDGGNDA